MSTTRIPAPGFTNPVHGAQQTFRGVLDALARPTRLVDVPTEIGSPELFTPAAAAIVLSVCDDATVLWLDERLRGESNDVEAWLAFHSGASIVDEPARAAFAIVSSPAALPELSAFALGTDEAPHTSTTIIVIDADGEPGVTYLADGPGFEHPSRWTAPAFPAGFGARWEANHAIYPRGVDLILAGRDTVVGLPRTTKLTEVN